MRRQKAKKRDFTLIEIIMVVIVIGIITTLAVPGYNNLIANSKTKVCEVNQGVILGAIEAYALENDQLPGVLGQLKNEHLEKTWAKVLKKNGGWKLKLAYFIVDFEQRGLAYAQGAWIRRYIGNSQYLICPADPTPPPAGVSYGINKAAANISYTAYKALDDDTIIACDSDTATFTDGNEAARHKKHGITPGSSYNYTLGISKAKRRGCKGAGCPGGFSSTAPGGNLGQGWMMQGWHGGGKN